MAEIFLYRHEKPYEDLSFLSDLYLKKGLSLRRISEELECSKGTVRKKLLVAGAEIKEQGVGDDYKALKKKIQAMRERGISYQAITDAFNLWKISTRSGDGQW